MILAKNEPTIVSEFHSKSHIDALDGVRGLACTFVVLDHFTGAVAMEMKVDNAIVHVLRSGWVGVDIFFVLSGFLITGILYDSRHSQHYFRNFIARRTLRIFPLYFGVLALVLVRCLAFPGATYGGLDTQLWLWTYLSNVGIALNGFGSFAFLGHFWSLSVEEHFYLLWPFLVLYLSRKRLMRAAILIAAGAFCGRTIAVLAGASVTSVYVLTPFRADALALGGLLALMVRTNGVLSELVRPARWAVVVSAACLIMMACANDGYLDFKAPVVQVYGFSLLAIASAATLVLAIVPGLLSHWTSQPTLRWLGKYSYGIYVWHPIALQVVLLLASGMRKTIAPIRVAVLLICYLALVVAAALASWHFWEKHFLKFKRHFE